MLLTGKGMYFCLEKFKTVPRTYINLHFSVYFNPLLSQNICLIHQLPALLLDLISGLECSWMLQAPSRKGICEFPQCNTLYTHVHLFTSCSTCMPDYWLLSFINLWGHCLQSQAVIATFMELTCLTSEIGKIYISLYSYCFGFASN